MAEPTQQDYENAGEDLVDLGLIVNGAADLANPGHPNGTVTTRLGGTVRTIANVIDGIEEVEETATASAAVAVESAEIAVAAVDTYLGVTVAGPIEPTNTGSTTSNTASYYWPQSVKDYDQWITKLELGAQTAGVVQIVLAKVEDDDTLSLYDTEIVSTAVGATVLDDLDLYLPAGHVAGIRNPGGGAAIRYSTDVPVEEQCWFIAGGLPASHTAKSDGGTTGVHFRFTLKGEYLFKTEDAYDRAIDVQGVVGVEEENGWPEPIVDTGASVPSGYVVVFQRTEPIDGFITRVEAGALVSGTTNLVICEVDEGTLVATVISSRPISLIDGVTVATLNIPIAAGQHVGFVSGYNFLNNGNAAGLAHWTKSGGLATGNVLTTAQQHRFELRYTFQSGLRAQATSSAAGNTGLDTLSLVDTSGADDVTAEFATAFSFHPAPYVRPGTYNLDTVQAHGSGLWGPDRAKVFVDDERLFLPTTQRLGNLFNRLRCELLEHIAAKDVLTLIADSIGHFAYAPTGPEHWFNYLTRFANLGIAKDEPIMTALRPSGLYAPSFYGVTTAGTVSTGTRGPIHESLILASGASITFTGAYESLGVFYTQEAGAGTLSFQFNGGAAFHTINAAGATELDKYGADVTGQVGSGTYTITASGGAVELTGLVRFGIKTAGSFPRLITNRSAHGSYTFGDFIGAQAASILKQGTAFGGKCVPLIALGINDSFGPGGPIANATTLLNLLEAGGVDRMFGIPPSRPGPSWDAYYTTNGGSYEGIGPLQRLYRERGVKMIQLDASAWQDEGLYQDALHPNGPGMIRYTMEVIEGIVR